MPDARPMIQSDDRWQNLTALALHGLRSFYRDEERLPHTMLWNGLNARPSGINVRYALISLIGLAKARSQHLPVDDLMNSLWRRVNAHRDSIADSAGDQGLAHWAQVLSGSDASFSAIHAKQVFHAHASSLDSVHLAWVLLGADHSLRWGTNLEAEEIAQSAKSALLKLYNPATNLFYRHARPGLVSRISRRVPCFANQIYPVLALAIHGRRTGCEQSLIVGRRVAENLCRLQGRLGQWWWLYDAATGGVVDGYPVFSVHQDGMAPMSLLETTISGGRSYQTEIDKGLSWIFGVNELETNLCHAQEGMVLRDIHKRGIGRVRRAMRSAAWCYGLVKNQQAAGTAGQFVINHECRPYHLGWILYAAAALAESARPKAREHKVEAGV